MPRIDLWALNENHVIKAEEEEHSPKSSEFSSPGIQNMTKQASEAWNSFIEQVGSMCAFTNIIILVSGRSLELCSICLLAFIILKWIFHILNMVVVHDCSLCCTFSFLT